MEDELRKLGTSGGVIVADGTPVELRSTVTCPACGHQATETMPVDACRFFYDCKACGARLKPKAGDCCVFCSYGTVRCPPMQTGTGCK
jgi:hypothetical protein